MEFTERYIYSDNEKEAEEEQQNYLNVLAALKFYRTHSMNRVNKTESFLNSLNQSHQDMLSKYRDHLTVIRHCIDANHEIIKRLIHDVDNLFENSSDSIPKQKDAGHLISGRVKADDLECVQVTLKQIARDWSVDGEAERLECYKPIIDEIEQYYPPNLGDISDVKVLVPGAGLGRLTYEIACRGYYCEGNEFSLFMLIASNFVLNRCSYENQYTLYPYVHQYVNNELRQHQVASVTFPDISPNQTKPKGNFNMVAGDFLQVYNETNIWDCVATCFFIDCANNVVQFIETIYNILKPGGVWINLGPLLYHYSDVPDECSIEPTYEDLLIIITNVGFEILKNQTGVRTKYAQNPRSMQQSEYLSIFTVCRKPLINN